MKSLNLLVLLCSFALFSACQPHELEAWDDLEITYAYDAYWLEYNPLELNPSKKSKGKCNKMAIKFDVAPKHLPNAKQQKLFINPNTGTIDLAATARQMLEENNNLKQFVMYYQVGKKLKKLNLQVELIDVPNYSGISSGRVERPGNRVRVSCRADGEIIIIEEEVGGE